MSVSVPIELEREDVLQPQPRHLPVAAAPQVTPSTNHTRAWWMRAVVCRVASPGVYGEATVAFRSSNQFDTT